MKRLCAESATTAQITPPREAKAELGRPFGLILGDVDNLREINDHEGHAVGNDVLRRVGDVLTRNVPSEDRLARIGGDELIRSRLSSAEIVDLPSRAERLRLRSQSG